MHPCRAFSSAPVPTSVGNQSRFGKSVVVADRQGKVVDAGQVDGSAIDGWYQRLTTAKGLAQGTAVRHLVVMHHMMAKAATIWSKETGIDRNPADEVEVKRPDDQRERYLAGEGDLQV